MPVGNAISPKKVQSTALAQKLPSVLEMMEAWEGIQAYTDEELKSLRRGGTLQGWYFTRDELNDSFGDGFDKTESRKSELWRKLRSFLDVAGVPSHQYTLRWADEPGTDHTTLWVFRRNGPARIPNSGKGSPKREPKAAEATQRPLPSREEVVKKLGHGIAV